jgi:hypothetical protein
MLATISLDLQK